MRPAVIALLIVAVCGCGQAAQAPATTSPQVPPSAAAVPPSPSVVPSPTATRPKIPPGMAVGYVVHDRRSGTAAASYNERRTFRSASVVKILIALDYLESRGAAAPPYEIQPMLRSSDDGAATRLWARGGKGKIIQRVAAKLGLTGTRPPPADKPGFWGYTAITAADIARTYLYLMDRADPKIRDVILGHLRKATQCGTDRFDQFFGIPTALPRPWAVKQGWSGYGSAPSEPCSPTRTSSLSSHVRDPALGIGRPVLHTTGVAGAGDRWIVVVLSLQPTGSSWRTSVARLTDFTGALYRSVT